MNSFWPNLVQALPPDVVFIANPGGLIMGEDAAGTHYVGSGNAELRIVSALKEVLQGAHLEFEDVQGVLRDILSSEARKLGKMNDSLLSAFLIGQHMNRETDNELEGYCRAFDNELGVAVGAGWQTAVAYVNIITYYAIGIPAGVLLAYVFHLEVKGIWIGMTIGIGVQTLVLIFMTWRTDWNTCKADFT